MKFATRCFIFCLMLTFICFCKTATADLVLNFSTDGGGSFANSFDVETSDSLTIGIFLQQTGADTVLTDEGIISFGLDLLRAPVNLGTISNRLANPVFDSENRNETTASGFEWEYGENAGAGITGNAILLGSFQYNSTADGTTTFTVEDRLVGSGAGSASWVTPSFNFLDEQIFGAGATGNFQFTVNATSAAVPEPSSLAMLTCIAGLVIGRRRR